MWVVGVKQAVGRFISKFVICKKLRGSGQIQQMADLPKERITPAPSFTYIGMDVFGP